MRASTKYTTAVHICIFLQHSAQEVVSSANIAKSVNTNPVVIRRLIQQLRKNGIVNSTGGAKGGFSLARKAAHISLWDIYLATREEELFKRPKINPDCIVSSNLKLLVHDVFDEAEKSMKKMLDTKTIADLDNKLIEILGEKEAKEGIKAGR